MHTKSPSPDLIVQSPNILPIPRCDFLGKILDLSAGLACIDKPAKRLQNVRRKRFLEKIKGSHQIKFIEQVLSHEVGLEFQKSLTHWLESTLPPNSPILIQRDELSRPDESCKHRASVVINTVGRCRDLEMTLNALSSSWDHSQDELIIVLGPNDDDSLAVISKCTLPLRLIRCPVKNLSISRNLGLSAALGRYIAFIDDDASPEPGWLDALLSPLQADLQVAIAAGFVLDGSGQKLLNGYVVADTLGRAQSFASHQDALDEINRIGEHRSFLTATGCNMAFRRDLLSCQGGFDAAFEYFLEETDAVLRLIHAGFRCQCAPNSLVRHRLSPNIARKPSFKIEQRNTIIRSQIHFVRKYGLTTFSAAEIKSILWSRLLSDLEKIAWGCACDPMPSTDSGRLQTAYIQSVTQHLGEVKNHSQVE
jgi:GT2 family glycosyltransferase